MKSRYIATESGDNLQVQTSYIVHRKLSTSIVVTV